MKLYFHIITHFLRNGKNKMSMTAISVALCITSVSTITTAFESIMNPTKLEEKPKIIDYGLKRPLDN